jgi:uncharacterized Rmd1/YagE family protein
LFDQLFSRTGSLVEQLERRDSVPFRTRPLNRFIGEAILARNEVLSVLHLLDKPEATWEDAVMDRIYNDLRAEFDLADRYAAMESKLCSIQEALELVLDVARDHRLLLLEVPVVLILAELYWYLPLCDQPVQGRMGRCRRLGWRPVGLGLIADLERAHLEI